MDYKLYQSKLIQNNHSSFINNCSKVYNLLQKTLKTTDSTWNYYKYNIFHLTSSSLLFYKLYKELNLHIRDFVGNDKPLWIQCWLNYHQGEQAEEKLRPHSHEWDYHGYISIEPQDTTTIFLKGYEIENKIGQIYIGHGNGQGNIRPELTHYVKINKPYNGTRITLGFDLATKPDEFVFPNVFFPLL
mgnify:CR=1 FL=1|jgi:hypothetical protein